MHLTREDRAKRREQIKQWAEAGASTAQISYWSGLSLSAVNTAIRYVMRPKLPKLKKTKRPSRLEQKRNDREMAAKHEAWRLAHVTRCVDYPHGACTGDHDVGNLEMVRLPGDCYACVCMSKLAANREAFGMSAHLVDLRIKRR